MNRKIFNYFEIAAKTATSKNDNRSFLLGAIAIRKDGAMVKSINSPTQFPNRQTHAEYRVCKKIDIGSTIYVARVRLLNGEFAISRPCQDCQKVLKHKKVHRAYYTISSSEFGMIDFEKNTESFYDR